MDSPQSKVSSEQQSSVSTKLIKNTLLIVEDDKVLLKMYTQKLSSEGFEVINANDGREALEKFQKEKIDLVLTDIMLPKMSGIEFLQEMRNTKKGKDIPVFVWTNLALEQEKKQAMSLGANEYLVKESQSLDEVVKLVKKYLS